MPICVQAVKKSKTRGMLLITDIVNSGKVC
ncbi:hypothetical protein EXIGUO9Y_90021 [Exiguobacterium oxidotolerans]|uniref:Uncharacterized protein n=1 Tax=Exiguobacterium oxidotolerans TaxID=223958 RepID=A0A653IHL7_9BACL|nr:hypothetical protein EXIGUO9Y_90021 [Exiguobacterium oxidotolerans]